MNVFAQDQHNIRMEWGVKGVKTLSESCDIIVIIDVLSFTTCVNIAVENGANVYPYYFKDERAKDFAESHQAELAQKRSANSKYSLSPSSMMNVTKETKLVLPSPNGATLSMESEKPTVAGCLRNAKAVAEYVSKFDNIGIIPSAERWHDDLTMRPSFEDLMGAGAIISYLHGNKSLEAMMAQAVFEKFSDRLYSNLSNCISGKELIEIGYESDVKYASDLNI